MKSASSPYVGIHGSALRAAWLGVSAGALGVLGLARWLRPDPSGMGTHVQLGLPPCGLLAATGLPCPACGLTTAFALMARGEVWASLGANAFGAPLFLLVACAVPIGAWGSVRAPSPARVLSSLHATRVLQALALLWMAVWSARLLSLAR